MLVVLIVGTAPLLLWFGRHQWFFLDEWAMLVDRDARDLHDLLAPHNGHWVTVPVLLWRLNFRLFGLTSYLPYQIWAVLGHLGVVTMLWLTMRHIGVRSWIATMTVLPFMLFGSGEINILLAFQISLTLSIICGVAHMLLVDHGGSINRRDAFGFCLGVVGLASSALAVPFVIGVGVTALLRRGWKVAVLHTMPFAGMFLAWYIVIGKGESDRRSYRFGPEVGRFVVEMIRATFASLGQVPPVGLALGILVLWGVGTAAVASRRSGEWSGLSVPLGLVAAAVGFAVVTGIARVAGFGVDSAAEGRYVYVTAASLLPLVALGGEALAHRVWLLGAVPVALLLIGLPANVERLDQPELVRLGFPKRVSALAYSPFIDDVPGNTRIVLHDFGPEYDEFNPTVGFLRRAARLGKINEPEGVRLDIMLWADGVLALRQREQRPGFCHGRVPTEPVSLQRGDSIEFEGDLQAVVVRGNRTSLPIVFDDARGTRVDVVAGPLDVVFTALDGQSAWLCARPRS